MVEISKRKGKILREWSEDERWSAYDTDTFYYAEVLDSMGNKHILKDTFKPYLYDEVTKVIKKGEQID